VLLLSEGARVGTGGSLRVTFMSTNKVEIFEQVSKLPLPFSLCLSPMAAKKFLKKNKNLGGGNGRHRCIAAKHRLPWLSCSRDTNCSATSRTPRSVGL